ncbi:MAG: Hint domain-containing protein, partial [Candidatus Aenigmatarchaeota archaeon]
MKSITSQAELLFSIISLAFIVSIIAAANITLNESENMTFNESSFIAPPTDILPPIYLDFGSKAFGNTIEFFSFWQDNFGLDKWIFSWNASGYWENESYSFISSYDEYTKVLTKNGWKYFKDLSYDDEVAVLSNNKIKWEKPLRIVSLPYNDKIYKINGEINIHVTKNHKVFARVDYSPIKKIKDFLFGIDLNEFKFIEIEKAYELAKAGYGITFLDENLKPIYVNKISLENYKGMIYDVTVPSHVILVKRDSKAVWSSNLNVLEGWSNITKTVNSSGTIAFKFYASDLAGNWNETEIGIINITQNESSALENIAQVKPEIKIEKIEHPLFVNVLQEFEVKAFITSFNVTTSLQAPQEFIVESLQKNLAQVGENESFIVSWLLKANKCGNYTLNITAEANESKDFKSFDVL